MKNSYDIIIRPLITEKTTKLVDGSLDSTEDQKQVRRDKEKLIIYPKYTFEVKQGSNKVEVKKAIEEIFNVKVVKVNMINTLPKARRVGKHSGLRPAVQKAVVTLVPGDKIDQYVV